MRIKMLALSAAVVVLTVASLGGANPASAHGGHTSCEGGIIVLVGEPGWPGPGPGLGPSGAELSALARYMASGGLEPGEPTLLAHEQFCEPKAP